MSGAHVPRLQRRKWDGHTTPEKHERVEQAIRDTLDGKSDLRRLREQAIENGMELLDVDDILREVRKRRVGEDDPSDHQS